MDALTPEQLINCIKSQRGCCRCRRQERIPLRLSSGPE